MSSQINKTLKSFSHMLLPSYATSIYVVGIFLPVIEPHKAHGISFSSSYWLLTPGFVLSTNEINLLSDLQSQPWLILLQWQGQATKGSCWGWHLTSHPFRWSFGQFRKPSELYWCSAHIPGCQERVCPMP